MLCPNLILNTNSIQYVLYTNLYGTLCLQLVGNDMML